VGAAEWGIQERWQDAQQRWHEVSPATVDRVLEAMGTDGEGSPPPAPTLFVRGRRHVGPLVRDGLATPYAELVETK